MLFQQIFWHFWHFGLLGNIIGLISEVNRWWSCSALGWVAISSHPPRL